MEETPVATDIATPVTDETVAPATEQAINDTVSEAVEASAKTGKPKPAFDDVDAVIKALAEQDEQLKAMKAQISEMITQNAALRRGIKQIVQDTAKNEELVAELTSARKKLATLKQFLGT